MLCLFSLRYVILSGFYFVACSGKPAFIDFAIKTPGPFLLRQQTPNYRTDENAQQGFDFTDDEMYKFKIWPQGIIPYFIDEFSFDKVLRDRIRYILNKISGKTPLQFVELDVPPKDDKERWVLFVNRRGQLSCVDYTTKSFTNSGVQKVVLGYDCLFARKDETGALAPTVLALAGVPPQHNAPDRDEHITVFTENILPDKKHMFEVLTDQDWLFHDLEYDFRSAGHYDLYMYTSTGQRTIALHGSAKSAYRDYGLFSPTDILKLNMLYNYIKKKKNTVSACSKLFQPGKNFDKFQPVAKNEEKPRKKAMKYLVNAQPEDNPETATENPSETPKEDTPEAPNEYPLEALKETTPNEKTPEMSTLYPPENVPENPPESGGLGSGLGMIMKKERHHVLKDTNKTYKKLSKHKIGLHHESKDLVLTNQKLSRHKKGLHHISKDVVLTNEKLSKHKMAFMSDFNNSGE